MEAPSYSDMPYGPLACVFSHLSSRDLVNCCLTCKHFAGTLQQASTPWHRALVGEHGYPGPESADARSLLAAAKTGGLWVWGGNVLGLAACRLNRFTSPEPAALVLGQPGGEEGGGGDGSTAAGLEASASVQTLAVRSPLASARLQAQAQVRIKEVSAGADFAVLLAWDGAVIDSRLLGTGPQQGQRRQRPLALPQLWRPPSSAIVAVAAGGCWLGPGKEGGGHVLALAADGSVWGWGANYRGQLGLGLDAEWVPAAAEVLDPPAAEALGGRATQVCCGDSHSGLLLHAGVVALAGSNLRGACAAGEDVESLPVFCLPQLPPGAAAAQLSCGGHNTAVVTAGGRLLVCGDNEFGQCGGGGAKVCWELTDLGPDARWHGMPRVNQGAQGGGGQAATRVVDVCCGNGSMYAQADGGDVFAWGQGGQGELGLGGSCKNTGSPSRLAWAHDVAAVSASAGGRFAAVIDSSGKLLTFGAGKFGQLGHGDANKRAVGRQVKALQQLAVRSAAAGADFMIAVTGWRPPPAGRGGGGAGARAGGTGRAGAAGGSLPGTPRAGAQQEGEAAQATAASPPPSPSFRYVDVEPDSPKGGSGSYGLGRRRSRGGLLAALLADVAGPGGPASPSSPPGSVPSTPHSQSSSSLLPDTPTTSASLPSLGEDPLSPSFSSAGGSGRPWCRRRHSGGLDPSRVGGEGSGSGNGGSGGNRGGRRGGRGRRWELPDPEEAVSRRRRWMAEPPAGEGNCSGGEEADREATELGSGGSDRRFRYLLRRQLKAFASSPQQRELAFPPSLSPSDRYKVHLTAEAWGLMHQSHGEGADRRILVWKPSRSKKSLKPGMLPRSATNSDAGGSAPGAAPAGEGSASAESGPSSLPAAAAGASEQAAAFFAGEGVEEEEGVPAGEPVSEFEALYVHAADAIV